MYKKLQEIFKGADQDRVEGYMSMFDRILLYTIASSILSNQVLDDTLSLWDKVIKNSIDYDASKRTNILESTTLGRAAKLQNEPDGESLRLHHLKQWKIAREIITANLQPHGGIDNDSEGFSV